MNVTMKRMITAGRLGRIHRISQVCTQWYRTQAYYDSGAWRGTWDGEGGGMLINQACHALDLFQWLGGMPTSVIAPVATRIHKIEVENTAEAIMQYANGAMGHFYVSTAHEPGLEFIEIFGDKGTLVASDGKLKFAKLAGPAQQAHSHVPHRRGRHRQDRRHLDGRQAARQARRRPRRRDLRVRRAPAARQAHGRHRRRGRSTSSNCPTRCTSRPSPTRPSSCPSTPPRSKAPRPPGKAAIHRQGQPAAQKGRRRPAKAPEVATP